VEETIPEERAAGPGPRLVLGLGNPGELYAASRHNLGFRVVDALAVRRGRPADRLECNALVAGPEDGVMLAKPLTYMNRSGHAARCLVERHGFAAEGLLVVYDEVSLPLGRLRLRISGGPGGHKGMESVISTLRTDEVARLRLGIAPAGEPPPGDELVRFVLAPFTAGEHAAVEEMVQRAADACEAWLDDGAAEAMNRFNG
jgi:PTH1 family peptidyl-tRNA hydrolase